MAVTTKIQVKDYLKEYIIGKFNNCVDGPVRFPDALDLYHVIWDLLEKRSVNAIDTGNLEIILPKRDCGKAPEVYNYLGVRSQKVIERKINTMMWAELHTLLDENKHEHGINYILSVHYFMRMYGIDSISEDAFLKNFYRWRDKIRRKNKKRAYSR